MSSHDMPVTLIIKAPNQQIEDQTIECELSWTIKRLKGYLSEVYPSKPHVDEQKLIYSGHLLRDSCILQEVLRTYEGHQQHTVHLVCARQATASPPKRSETLSDGLRRRATSAGTSQSTTSSNHSANASGHGSSNPNLATVYPASGLNNTSTNTSNPPTTATTSTSTTTLSADPRHAWAAYYPGSQFPPYAQFPQIPSHTVPPQMAQLTQAQYAAWMQQAYAQYMAQYMHLMMAQASGSPMQWPLAASVTANDPSAVPNNDQPAAAQGQGGNAAERAGAAEDAEDDENAGQRDWLDWFYIMSRLAVLFSVVYFYSSPMRFIVVFALGLFLYLYQIGFFRPEDALENNNDPARADAINNNIINNDDNNNEPAAQAAAAGPENAAEGNEAAPEAPAAGGGGVGGAGVGDAAPQEGNAQPNIPEIPDRPSLLALSWTFFTSFFASLIPEQPNII